MAKQSNSRPARWARAVERATAALDAMEAAREELVSATAELGDLQSEYGEWLDSLSDNLAGSTVAAKLEAIIDLDTNALSDGLEDQINDARYALDDFSNADLPRGFGRD